MLKIMTRVGRTISVLTRPAILISLTLVFSSAGLAAQHYILPIEVDSSTADRTDKPVNAPIDLTDFLTLIGGSLDLNTLQVAEVDPAGVRLDTGVLFQFDPGPGFAPAIQAAGNLVFIMAGDTPASTIRHYQLWFDVDGGCVDCPPPPVVANPVTVDSLTYENQLTYLIDTPRADYYYHVQGAGLASLMDTDGQDWIGFHDIPGSGSAGEYRGIPNLVFKSGQPQNSYFHPGFTNAYSRIVSAGPLKVTVASESGNPSDLWQVLWEFYPSYARMTVQTVGVTNDGKYWFLYEGTMGGAMDANDVVVRSTGVQTSAFDYVDSWEEIIPDPGWVCFHDQDASRILYLGHDLGDGEMDSYRPQGQSSESTPEMTVFGYGRVLNTSPDKLVPRISGAGQTFTLGLMGDQNDPAVEIAGASEPLTVTVGSPDTEPSGVDDGNVPVVAVLYQNYPNPFNPRTMITFTLPVSSRVRLDILDLQGRRVANLMDGILPEGSHSVMFDGKELPSGIYISRLVSGGISQESKMMLIR